MVFNIRDFMASLYGSIGGKWDILRDYLAMKGISFLVLCKDEGEDKLVNENVLVIYGMKGNSLAIRFKNWIE
jgi:hypothetical protein